MSGRRDGAAPPAAANDPKVRRPPALFRLPIFRLLWTGSLTSSIGSSAGAIVLLWLVFVETGSALDVAYLGLAGLVPRIAFGLLSGAFADRFPRLRLMIVGDLLRAGTLGALGASLLGIGFSLPFLLAAAVLLGVGQTLFRPAFNAYVPTVVPPSQLGQANGFLTSAQEVTGILGGPLGTGLLVTLGAAAALFFNGATYLASAALIVAIGLLTQPGGARPSVAGRSPAARDTGPAPTMVEQIREGFAYLRGEPTLLELTLASLAGNFFLSLFSGFLVIYVGAVLGAGAVVFGALAAVAGAGFAAGSLLVGRLHPEQRFGRWFAAGWCVSGVAILGLVVVRSPFVAGPLLFALGVGGGFGNTTFFTGVQRYVPNRLLGRYLSLDEVGSLAAAPAGLVAGGLIVASAGLLTDFLVAGAGAVASMVVLLANPQVHRLTVTDGAAATGGSPDPPTPPTL